MPPTDPPGTATPGTVHSLADALTRRLIRQDRQARFKEGLGTPATSTPAETAAAMCHALTIPGITRTNPDAARTPAPAPSIAAHP